MLFENTLGGNQTHELPDNDRSLRPDKLCALRPGVKRGQRNNQHERTETFKYQAIVYV